LADFNELVLAPDFTAWGLWFDNGPVALYMYMTEFIARSVSKADMSVKTPLYS
jgi:hypothetical protein